MAVTLDDMVRGFVETAIWADLRDENGDTDLGEYFYEDLTPLSLTRCWAECEAFLTDNLADLTLIERSGVYSDKASWNIGGDFWLTSQRHGAGFWDRKSVNPSVDAALDRLTKASHFYGFNTVMLTADDKVEIE